MAGYFVLCINLNEKRTDCSDSHHFHHIVLGRPASSRKDFYCSKVDKVSTLVGPRYKTF